MWKTAAFSKVVFILIPILISPKILKMIALHAIIVKKTKSEHFQTVKTNLKWRGHSGNKLKITYSMLTVDFYKKKKKHAHCCQAIGTVCLYPFAKVTTAWLCAPHFVSDFYNNFNELNI